MPTLLKFLKSLVKKLGFLKEGTLDVKPIFLIVKIRSMTAAKFSSVLKFLSCCYLLLLKISVSQQHASTFVRVAISQ
jgi:hypothetical protein